MVDSCCTICGVGVAAITVGSTVSMWHDTCSFEISSQSFRACLARRSVLSRPSAHLQSDPAASIHGYRRCQIGTCEVRRSRMATRTTKLATSCCTVPCLLRSLRGWWWFSERGLGCGERSSVFGVSRRAGRRAATIPTRSCGARFSLSGTMIRSC